MDSVISVSWMHDAFDWTLLNLWNPVEINADYITKCESST